MAQPSGVAAYAAGVAMLSDGDVVDQLVGLANGDADALRDARDVLYSVRADRGVVERASRQLQRAIERVERP